MRKNRKKKSSGKWLSNAVLFLALGVFLFSGFKLLMIFLEYRAGTEEYKSVRRHVITAGREGTEGAGEEETDKKIPPSVDFASLQEENPDVIGWLLIEGLEDISYPIMKSTDNEYYLKHTFEGKKNSAGSIFADMHNSTDFGDCNTIIYGHNMKNGSMFGMLKHIKNEGEGYAVSPYFWICTPDGNYLYEIFSVHEADAAGDTYSLFSAGGSDFAGYLEKMKGLSEIETGVEMAEQDKIVTLSTCTSNDSVRFVVQGKRLPEVY